MAGSKEILDPRVSRRAVILSPVKILAAAALSGIALEKDKGEHSPTAWAMSRELEALYIESLIPDNNPLSEFEYQRKLGQLESYWKDQIGTPSYSAEKKYPFPRFTDDNLWLAFIHTREYKKQAGNEFHLKRAKQIFDLSRSQWSREGGVFWEQQFWFTINKERGIVSNATSVILAAQLYDLTGEKTYLDDAETIFNWVEENLKDPNDGLYFDHIQNGQLNKTKWSYNQGTMIAATLMLSEALPDKYSIDDALELAKKSLKHYLESGFSGQPSSFNGIYFLNLFYLLSKINEPNLKKDIKAAIDIAIKTADKNPTNDQDKAGLRHLIALGKLPESLFSTVY